MISLLQGNLQVALAFVASSQGTMLYYYLEVIYTLLILYTYHKKREIFHTCVREKLHEKYYRIKKRTQCCGDSTPLPRMQGRGAWTLPGLSSRLLPGSLSQATTFSLCRETNETGANAGLLRMRHACLS